MGQSHPGENRRLTARRSPFEHSTAWPELAAQARREGQVVRQVKPTTIAVELPPSLTPRGDARKCSGGPAPSVGCPDGGRPSPCPGGVAEVGASGGSSDRGAALGRLPGYGPSAENKLHARHGVSREERLLSGFWVRARLRKHATCNRIAKCGRVVHTDPAVVTELTASGERQARWTGVVTCQRTGCPVCEGAKARKLGRVVRRIMGGGGTWQHVALTVPHTAGESWGRVYQRAVDGVRGLSKGAVGRVLRPLLLATVRATETTWSERHGWHVHFHVLWKLARPLTQPERDAIAAAWADLTEASLEHGVHFGRCYYAATAGDAASYLEKLALEITGAGKLAHGEHWTLGELYQRAARGERVDLIQHYQRETRGRRLYQLDRRAKRLHDSAPELAEQVIIERWVTPIERKHFSHLSRAESSDPLAIYLPLEVAIRCRGDPGNDVEDQVFELIRLPDLAEKPP